MPMLGARTLAQLEDNLGALEFTLTPEQRTRLDEVSRLELGFPHDFLRSDFVRSMITGGAKVAGTMPYGG